MAKVHERLSVTEAFACDFATWSDEEQKQWVASKSLYGGYPVKYVEQKEKEIIGRINHIGGGRKKAKKSNPSGATKRNRKNNLKG